MARAQQKSSKPITAAQIKRIHTIKHILGVSDENYRECLDSRFGVSTSKALTVQQATSFIDELEKLALQLQGDRYQAKKDEARQKAEEAEAQKPKRFDHLDNRPGMASGAQLRKIEAMWQDISIIPEPEPRARALRQFIKRIVKVADMRFLNSQDAGKVINALSAMSEREMEPEKAKSRKTAREALDRAD